MYKVGDRVNLYVDGRVEKGTIVSLNDDSFIIRLLDGSEVNVLTSHIIGKTN